MKIYDIIENNRGGYRVMSSGIHEDAFNLSLCKDAVIKMRKVYSIGTGEPLILRYDYELLPCNSWRNEKIEEYIKKHYNDTYGSEGV